MTADNYLMNNYARIPLSFVKGEGVYLYDQQGNQYLDFTSGIAVNNLGHCPTRVTQAIQQQAETLVHTSNLFAVPLQSAAAEKLCQLSQLDQVFFCNSGAEANEAAIKLARKYSKHKYGEDKYEIITLQDAFHGRTLGALSATPRAKFQEGFAPLVAGFKYVAKDLTQIEAALSKHTCAIMLEPIQGEGGVLALGQDFLRGVRQLCDKYGLLLIIDEVQTGIGRTGTMFAYQQMGVKPDILTLAKALGNGVPVGATLATAEVATAFSAGTHGSTFGGTPLVMSAVLAVLSSIEQDNILENVKVRSQELDVALTDLIQRYDSLVELTGTGLLKGVKLNQPVARLVTLCREQGLLVLGAGETTLRLLPPLIISSQHIKQAMTKLEKALMLL